MKKKQQTFESAIQKLEAIVRELESGDPPLEKALKTFEEGMALARFCSETLDETERKIELLMTSTDGAVVRQPVEPDDDLPTP